MAVLAEDLDFSCSYPHGGSQPRVTSITDDPISPDHTQQAEEVYWAYTNRVGGHNVKRQVVRAVNRMVAFCHTGSQEREQKANLKALEVFPQ